MKTGGRSMERAINTWEQRKEDPLPASEVVIQLAEEDLSPFGIALALGARPAEVVVFQDLASLASEAQEIIVKNRLPLDFATELAGEPEGRQIEALNAYLQEGKTVSDPYATLGSILRRLSAAKGVSVQTLEGKHLMHLASKAKQYNALSGKGRFALFDIGRKMRWGLSVKQQRYVDSLLEKLEQVGILTAHCQEEPCDLCVEVRALMETS